MTLIYFINDFVWALVRASGCAPLKKELVIVIIIMSHFNGIKEYMFQEVILLGSLLFSNCDLKLLHLRNTFSMNSQDLAHYDVYLPFEKI